MSSNEPRKRLKAAESRRALLNAGLELLKSHGVAPGLDRVTLKEAIEVSGVPRSTAYRLYEGGRGQLEEFRADLLADLDSTRVDGEPLETAIAQALEEIAPLIESRDPGQLASGLRELIRVAMQANLESLVDSLEWRVYMSSLASLGTGFEADPSMTEMFREAADAFGQRFVDFFSEISKMFGIRARAGMTEADFARSVSAIVEGVALRTHVNPRLGCIKRPTGRNSEPQSWNAAAIAVEALLLTWAEPDPAAVVSADLGSWTSF